MQINMKDKSRLIIGLSVLVLLGCSLFYCHSNNLLLWPAFTTAGFFNKETPDHLIGRYTTIVDEEGSTISEMARIAASGDELYTSEGRHYRVERVQGDRAEAKFLGMDSQILAYNEYYANQSAVVVKNLAEKSKSTFAVYHSHTDESYVPSDGTDAIPFKGGIYQVGKTMADRLQGSGYQVDYDQTPHDPHDNNAYTRSRRTATSLMKKNPSAIFDVHRDGVPDPNYYRTTIDGKSVAKLRLVIGRENPRMSANMDFAKQMMASANNLHPKVVKEIFVGKGDYNQDLTPTALLIEAGTHTNTKEEAEMGMSMFSEAIPVVLGLSPTAPAAPGAPVTNRPSGTTTGAWKALGWILGLTIVGGLAFLLISSGGLENAKKRLTGFGREFNSFLGPRVAARKLSKPDQKATGENVPGDDSSVNEALRERKDDLTKD